jgi:uncharacterized protein (TIGR02246 family)
MNLAIPQTLRKYSLYAITVDDYVESIDEKKIRNLFEKMQTAWEKKDAKTFGSCYTEDSDFVNFRGDHFKGKENNISKHVQFNNTRLYINIKSIRFLNNEMAIVHAEGKVLQEYETVTSKCKLSYTTNIMVKENGEWKITSFHNSKKEKTGIITRFIKWISGKK